MSWSRLVAVVEAAFLLVALLSLAYALVTAPASGIDVKTFQEMGRHWRSAVNQTSARKFYGPPPFTVVLVSPLSLISLDLAIRLMLGLNLLAAGLTIYLAILLVGGEWSLKARFYLSAFFLSLASLRVTLRNGQLSLLVTALLLGALCARKNGQKVLAGVLLGLSLCKYPLSFPFVLYLLWRKEWKTLAVTVLVPASLTAVFAFRLGLSPVAVTSDYVHAISDISLSNSSFFAGSTDIKPLIVTLTGRTELLPALLVFGLSLFALLAMVIAFKREPQLENWHFAVLALFALWSVYHRSYDAVLCVVPAALLMDFIVRRKFLVFSAAGLAGLALLAIGIPGLLTDRLHLSADRLSGSLLGFLGLHAERLLVFGMFWSLLFLLWRSGRSATPDSP